MIQLDDVSAGASAFPTTVRSKLFETTSTNPTSACTLARGLAFTPNHASSRQFTPKSDGVTPGVNGVNWRDVGVNGVNWRDAGVNGVNWRDERCEWRIDVTSGVVGVTLGVKLQYWRERYRVKNRTVGTHQKILRTTMSHFDPYGDDINNNTYT